MLGTDRAARDQFVNDFLLVVENDEKTYNEYKALVKDEGLVRAGERIQNDFEGWIDSLATIELMSKNEVGSLLLRQLLSNWGFDAFYSIAERFEEEVERDNYRELIERAEKHLKETI
jgi:capsule polysaccharide export protein KpsE/RkpR